ncbi:Uncharacterized protein HZ326_0786 [Fusarium oxysporum f. sp. albedinis]|nr:Uncharacterized protein HZ326_0786 [Fusarium oxysporum f. sp. albedinis]
MKLMPQNRTNTKQKLRSKIVYPLDLDRTRQYRGKHRGPKTLLNTAKPIVDQVPANHTIIDVMNGSFCQE